jgi:LacI family transcriptional regulator
MTDPEGPVTLATIANAVGVHVSTVSRVLRSAGPRTATGERIIQMAEELGFTPHPAAAALRTRTSRLIGVLMARLTDFVPARAYEGIDEAAFAAGYNTVIAQGGDDPTRRLERLKELLSLRVDGMIILDARLRDDQVLAEIARRGVPCVLALRRVRGLLSSTTDDLRGGALVAKYLDDLGHVNIGVVAGPQSVSTGQERLEGFVREMHKRGRELPQQRIVYSDFDVTAGLNSARRLLALEPHLTAVFAANDDAAIGVFGALGELGLRPGTDVSVVGYNDVPYAAHIPVPLTSVASPVFEVGKAAADLLIRRLSGAERLRSVRLLPHLVARESSMQVRPRPGFPDSDPHGQRNVPEAAGLSHHLLVRQSGPVGGRVHP